MKQVRWVGSLRGGLAAVVAATAMMSVAAFAQDSSSATAAPPPANDSAWVKICSTDDKGNKICNISQVLLASNGTVIASFSLQPNGDKVTAGAFVPLGFMIPAGIALTICVPPTDNGPAGCAARADTDANFVAAMRKGNKLGMVLTNTAGQPIPIEMTLIGFSKTYDSDGLDPATARAREVEASKALQEEARAAFQRMIDKQRQENGTNATTPPAN
jgi:invasion protein IalB